MDIRRKKDILTITVEEQQLDSTLKKLNLPHPFSKYKRWEYSDVDYMIIKNKQSGMFEIKIKLQEGMTEEELKKSVEAW